ncbi:hypothetical protein V6Z11_D06G158100 [Gossypium hirsutum]
MFHMHAFSCLCYSITLISYMLRFKACQLHHIWNSTNLFNWKANYRCSETLLCNLCTETRARFSGSLLYPNATEMICDKHTLLVRSPNQRHELKSR